MSNKNRASSILDWFNRAVVFAAHPDDEIIGCGGTIAKMASSGTFVEVIYMSSTDASGDLNDANRREAEAELACKRIGVEKWRFLRLKGRYIEYNKETLEEVVRILKEDQPMCIFVNHPKDGDIDHRSTYNIVREASWLCSHFHMPQCGKNECDIQWILLYEVWTPLQTFNYLEDISDFIQKKISALQEYQLDLSRVRYDKAIHGLNAYRAIMNGVGDFAEAFRIKRLSIPRSCQTRI